MQKQNNFKEISLCQKVNDFCLIFYYKTSHSLTSNLFKKEFYVKFEAPLKAIKDYFDFNENPNYSSITFYDNISITFSEEIIDLYTLKNSFSEIKNTFIDNINLYELDLQKIHEKLMPLTNEFVTERFQKKNISLGLILTQINLSLQLFDITDLRSSNLILIYLNFFFFFFDLSCLKIFIFFSSRFFLKMKY